MGFRDRYFEALGISLGDTAALEAALKRAVETRNFEIELYWKRATYFWLFQGAAFTIFGLVFEEKGTQHLHVFMPAAMGALTAFVGFLAAKGSKFWQENWEKQVDMLEDALGQRLTQTIICDKGLSYSVSKLNESFMLFMSIIWSGFMLGSWLGSLWPAPTPLFGVLLLVGFVFCGLYFWLFCKSTLIGKVYNEDANQWEPQLNKGKNTLLWRYPPHRDPA